MTINIDVNGIKNGLLDNWESGATIAKEWMGRAIILLKSGVERALPYLQDKRIAVVSLIAVNLILIEMADLFEQYWQQKYPNDSLLRDVVDFTFLISAIGAGVTVFTRYANLPLSALSVAGISVGTLIVRCAIS